MTKRAKTHTSHQFLQQRMDVKKSFNELKAVEGGDISLALYQSRYLDTKTQLQWVCCGLQRELYKLRGEIIKRQDVDDDRREKDRTESTRLASVIENRKTAHAKKSWFRLFWEWIKLVPIGKRSEYEPENFEDDSPRESKSNSSEIEEINSESNPSGIEGIDNDLEKDSGNLENAEKCINRNQES